jgi:hypothetical protein
MRQTIAWLSHAVEDRGQAVQFSDVLARGNEDEMVKASVPGDPDDIVDGVFAVHPELPAGDLSISVLSIGPAGSR